MKNQNDDFKPPDDFLLDEIRQYLEKLIGARVLKRKIKTLGVRSKYRWQADMKIKIGKYYSKLEPNSPKEQILAIFESSVFCVCTAERGMKKGMPYLFNKEDVYLVEEIDSTESEN